jgi:hypothetical protein
MNSEQGELMSDEERIDMLDKIYREQASKVKAGMFMLDIIRADKEVFGFLEKNDMIPTPSKVVTLTYGREKIRLSPEETADYYDNVQRYFVERINMSKLTEGDVPTEDRLKERLIDRVNAHWSKSRELAERDWKASKNSK